MSPHSLETLGEAQQERLFELEKVVEAGLRAFVKVGAALKEIADHNLYTAHATFDEYCRQRWEMSGTQAYRLISAAEIAEIVTAPNGETLPPPANEAQARALAPLKGEPERVREVWGDVVKENGENITADAVRAAVEAARPEVAPTTPTKREPGQKRLSERSWQLVESDIEGAFHVVDSTTVPLIATIPSKESVESQLDRLYALAAEKLLEGGSLAVVLRQDNLHHAMSKLAEYPALTFRWVMAIHSPERGRTEYGPHARAYWQPVLWATRGKYRGEWVDDVVSDAEQIVTQLTKPGDLILDPFCGKGELGAAVIEAGRDYMGVEQNPVALGEAKRRRATLL